MASRKVKVKGWQPSIHTSRESRVFAVTVRVWPAGREFEACARVRSNRAGANARRHWGGARGEACDRAGAPRRAAAKALRKLASKLVNRSSAFAGVR